MKAPILLPTVVFAAIVATACGTGEAEAPAGAATSDASSAEVSADAATAAERGGTLEIGDERYTVVPAVQCRVFPGPVAYVAGHVVGDESIEITMDYSPDDGLASVAVTKPDGMRLWWAEDEAVKFEISGQTISGRAAFSSSQGGDTTEGRFDIRCG